MRIAIIGTQGVGKTTLAAQMFAYASQHGMKAKFIHEIARDCPLPLNENFTTEAATWIVSKHICEEIEARAKGADFIICDRSCFDPVIYAINKISPNMQAKEYYRTSPLYRFAEHGLRTYDAIIYVRPVSYEILGDGIRSTNPLFQREIDDLFEKELKYLQIGFRNYIDKPIIQLYDKYIRINSDEIFNRNNTELFEYLLQQRPTSESVISSQILGSHPYTTRY